MIDPETNDSDASADQPEVSEEMLAYQRRAQWINQPDRLLGVIRALSEPPPLPEDPKDAPEA